MSYILVRMKKKKQSRWIDAIWTTALSVAIGFSFYFLFGKAIFEMFLSQINEADILTSYYSVENRSLDVMASDDEIVLFNTDGEKSRVAIAEAIKKISDCSPKKIGVDMIFSPSSSVDASVDSVLENTLASLPNVVLAARIVEHNGKYGLEHSFFTVKRGLVYGAVNMDNLCTYTAAYRVNGERYATFSAQLADAVSEKKRTAVNFSNKMFTVVPISDTIVPEDFKDKIVLVGDLNDLRDTHDIGFPICGSRRVAGTMLTAYAVSSLVHDDWIVKVPEWINLFIGLVLTYLATVLCYRIKDRWKLGDLAERIIQIIQFILLLFIGYMVFTCFGISVNVLYAAAGIALMGLSIDLLDTIKRKKDD